MFLFFLLLLCYCITHGPPGSLLVAVTVRQQQPRSESSVLCVNHRRCFCVYVYVCALLYVPDVGMECVSQDQCTAAAQQQQYNDSRVVSSRLCASIHGVCMYVCVVVVGAQQEIEPRRHFHVQCNNQTHIVGPQTRCTNYVAVARAAAHTHHWNAYVPPFCLATPPRYQANPPEGVPCIRCIATLD